MTQSHDHRPHHVYHVTVGLEQGDHTDIVIAKDLNDARDSVRRWFRDAAKGSSVLIMRDDTMESWTGGL